MGAHPGSDFTSIKWPCIIINDDFLLRPITPNFNYLPWQISHCLKVYIQSLTTASGSRLLGSVVRALDFYPNRLRSNSTIGGNFFQLCFIPLLRLSCCKKSYSKIPLLRPLANKATSQLRPVLPVSNRFSLLYVASDNRDNIFVIAPQKICCGYSLEVPHRGTSNEYPQHIFWRSKKNIYFFVWLKKKHT